MEIKYIPESHAEHAVSLPSGSTQLHTWLACSRSNTVGCWNMNNLLLCPQTYWREFSQLTTKQLHQTFSTVFFYTRTHKNVRAPKGSAFIPNTRNKECSMHQDPPKTLPIIKLSIWKAPQSAWSSCSRHPKWHKRFTHKCPNPELHTFQNSNLRNCRSLKYLQNRIWLSQPALAPNFF